MAAWDLRGLAGSAATGLCNRAGGLPPLRLINPGARLRSCCSIWARVNQETNSNLHCNSTRLQPRFAARANDRADRGAVAARGPL